MTLTRTENRYHAKFSQLNAQGQKIFMPFTLLGWPSVEQSFQIVQTMIDAGVSALELGFPFSDPVADGPIIQAAGQEALANGFTTQDAFNLLERIRAYNDDIPIGLLIYYNLILAQGIDAFFQKLGTLGVDGVLIPDLPPESAAEVAEIAQKNGLQLIFIISPLTNMARLSTINQYAGGFHYVVSRLGITGVDERTDKDLASLIQTLKQASTLPVCVGFGISSPHHAQEVLALGADGVITGSKIVQLVKSTPEASLKEELTQFLHAMLQTCQPQ